MTRRLLRKNRPSRRPRPPQMPGAAEASTLRSEAAGADGSGDTGPDDTDTLGSVARGADQDPRRLADAARSCSALRAADRLAGWIGEGRAVQTAPVLFPVQLATVARVLGGEDAVARLAPVWGRAQHAGLIETRGNRTMPGPTLDAWRAGEPSIVLQVWREAYESYTGLNSATSDEPYVRPEAFGAQAALRVLSARGRSMEPAKLRAKVTRILRTAQRGLTQGLLDPTRDAQAGLALLLEFGAVTEDEHTVRLTPLGQWLARSRRDQSGWARGLVDHLRARGPDGGDALIERWLGMRNPARAVRDLLTVAADGDVAQRMVAVRVAHRAGAAAQSEWRRWVDHPRIGPHARLWVATVADGTPPEEKDADWTMLDGLAGLLHRSDRPEVRDAVRWHCHEVFGLEATSRMAAVDHPDRDLVVAVLTDYHAFQQYYRLRVELCDVEDPPVWRTFLVPGGSTLEQLHRAVSIAVGWDGRHEYVFEIGGQTYASFGEERHGSGAVPRLRDLAGKGDSFGYEYDELDRWRHVITVEADDEDAPAGQWARVLDGGGACPPQGCGGVESYQRLRWALLDSADPDSGHARELFAVERPEDLDWQEFDPTLPNAVLAADTFGSASAA